MFKRLLVALFALIAATAFAAVDVNKASSAELDGVKGIGPAIATKILDERKKGNFKDWNDLVSRVSGIGEGSAAKLSAEGLTVNGQGFKGAAPAAKTEKAAAKTDAKAADAKATETPAKATKVKAEAKADAPAAKADAKPADAKSEKADKAAEKKAAKEAKKAEKADKAAAKADAASAAKK